MMFLLFVFIQTTVKTSKQNNLKTKKNKIMLKPDNKTRLHIVY